MTAPTAARAIAIGRPLWQSLRAEPFSGSVVGRFASVCNLADARGRVIAFALPALGNGPFSIVAPVDAEEFAALQLGQVAFANAARLVVGGWQLPLAHAHIWDARLPTHTRLRLTPALVASLRPYAEWPLPAADTPMAAAMARLLARGAGALRAGLAQGCAVAAAARQLAGLGHGLTPAGDDYLLGAMTALWLLGERQTPAIIAQNAAPHTTTLSGAFLLAAAQGQFTEPWHQLADALAGQYEPSAALDRIARLGATSGRDALAGFAAILLESSQGRSTVPSPQAPGVQRSLQVDPQLVLPIGFDESGL